MYLQYDGACIRNNCVVLISSVLLWVPWQYFAAMRKVSGKSETVHFWREINDKSTAKA